MSVSNELTAKFAQKLAELTGLTYALKIHENGRLSYYIQNDQGVKIHISQGRYNEEKCHISICNLYPTLTYNPSAYNSPKLTTETRYLKLPANFPNLSFGFTVNAENWEKSAIRASKCEIFKKLPEYHQEYLAEVERQNKAAKDHQSADLLAESFQKFAHIYPKVFSNSIEMTISVLPNDTEKIQDLRNFLEKWNKKETD